MSILAIKETWAAITRRMVENAMALTSELTDWIVGSPQRAIVESVAIEIDELKSKVAETLTEAIDQATYRHYDFNRLPATAAYGTVRFYCDTPASADITIPKGTKVTIPATTLTYETDTVAVLQAEETSVDVKVVATIAGTTHNTSANTITNIKVPIAGIDGVTNPEAIATGKDEETDSEMLTRFQQYISTLSRGVKEAIVYGAKTTKLYDDDGRLQEYVVDAVALTLDDDPSIPPATTLLYIHNGTSTVSTELLAECQKVIDGYYDVDNGVPIAGYKGAGCVVYVEPVNIIYVDVTIDVDILAGFDPDAVTETIVQTITDYLHGLSIGQTCQIAEIVARTKVLNGVENIIMRAPLADIEPDSITVIMPGDIDVTVV